MDITTLCYELITIKGELKYYKALFGSIVLIVIKSNDYRNGFINATKLCLDNGKLFGDWLEKNICDICYVESDPVVSGVYVSDELLLNIIPWLSKDLHKEIYNIIKKHNIEYFNNEVKNNLTVLNSKVNEYKNVASHRCRLIDLIKKFNELNTNDHRDCTHTGKVITCNIC